MSHHPPQLVLGIESSCDDTACAILDGAGRILSSVVSSQLDAHAPFGGVVPEIASREHLRNWPAVSAAALAGAGVDWGDLDLVAATRGPGLVGSLLVGLSLGKAAAFALGLPFCAVHHLEGHLYSPFLSAAGGPAEPLPDSLVGLVVSGGHTSLYRVRGDVIRTLAETRDDAVGEAFDKIGKRLGLPFPGGPHVDRLAELGRPEEHPLAIASCGASLDFSYSGLKSQALLELDRLEQSGCPNRIDPGVEPAAQLLDLIAGFRAAAVGQILDRVERLHRQSRIDLLAVSGGAAANRLLRRELERWAEERQVPLRLVPLGLSGDNAAMIGFAALLRHRRGSVDDPRSVEAASRLPIAASPPRSRAGGA